MDSLKWIEIDLDAVRSNVAWARGRLEPGVDLMAVVKADGYGHGAVPVARVAAKGGAACLGVLTLEEALDLRRAGLRLPIVVLSPPLPSQAAAVARARVEPTVDSEPLLKALSAAAGASRPIPVHLDVDFGLRRWGAPPSKVSAFAARVKRSRGLRLAGLSTHIDYVPGKNAVEAEQKLRAFQRLAARLKPAFPGLKAHAANSSILMDFPHWQLDMVRVGNLLYGINRTGAQAELMSPWKFNARIIALSRVRRGEPIGYASEYVAPRPMTVATVAVGYSDGLTMEPVERLISFRAGFSYWGMLDGKQAPFVGRCGISHVMLDVSAVPSVRVGSVVTLPIRRTAASARLPRVHS